MRTPFYHLKNLSVEPILFWPKSDIKGKSGANPTIVIYSAISRVVRFENKNIFILL
jgi:hypothetical protein